MIHSAIDSLCPNDFSASGSFTYSSLTLLSPGLTRFGAGVHSFWKAEKDLPVGIAPSVLRTWNDAVLGGYFVG